MPGEHAEHGGENNANKYWPAPKPHKRRPETAQLLKAATEESTTDVAPPPFLRPDGSPSPYGYIHSAIHRRSPQTEENTVIVIPEHVVGVVGGALLGFSLYGVPGAIVGAVLADQLLP